MRTDILLVPDGALNMSDRAVRQLESMGYNHAWTMGCKNEALLKGDNVTARHYHEVARGESEAMRTYILALVDIGVIKAEESRDIHFYFRRLGRRMYKEDEAEEA